ncbi:homeobox domain-containing protein [Sporodiniella umbellata]|nr:homeobox domain-containing protein [Sporodiniella umbellata]
MTKTTTSTKSLENRKASGTAPNFTPNFYNPHEVKHRRKTSREQAQILERSFHKNPKPSGRVRENLASDLAMSPRGVQIWFQNRRAKAKHQPQQQKDDQTEKSHDSSYTDSQSINCQSAPMVYQSTPMVHSNSQSSLSSYPESLDSFHPLTQPLSDDVLDPWNPYTMSDFSYPIISNQELWSDSQFSSYQNGYTDNSDWIKSKGCMDPCLDPIVYPYRDGISMLPREKFFIQPMPKEPSHVYNWVQTVPLTSTKQIYSSVPIKNTEQLYYENTMMPYFNDVFIL